AASPRGAVLASGSAEAGSEHRQSVEGAARDRDLIAGTLLPIADRPSDDPCSFFFRVRAERVAGAGHAETRSETHVPGRALPLAGKRPEDRPVGKEATRSRKSCICSIRVNRAGIAGGILV